MDTSDPEIVFDKNGFCNHCNDFFSKWKEVNKNMNKIGFLRLFEDVKRRGRNAKYDCIVGVSGGVDSSTVLRLAVEHGLRVLAVHMDNGWNSPVAARNINRLIDTLKVDYASYVLPWDDFRRVQLAFLRASVPEVETPTDIAIQRALHLYAKRFGVVTILGGGNNSSEGILPISWHYNARDNYYANAILNSQGCSSNLYASMRFSLPYELHARLVNRIKTFYPLNYIDYDKQEARKILEDGYGWTYYGSKHGESRFTKFIQTYYLYKKHGIDYRRATASSEMCLGKLSREEVIRDLDKLPYESQEIHQEIIYVAKKLAISQEELVRIVQMPPKWYYDYPNRKRQLGFLYDCYRLISRKKKTSNF